MATLLWIECGACGGESMAILGAEGPGQGGDNLPEFLEAQDVCLFWHRSLSLESPSKRDGRPDREPQTIATVGFGKVDGRS